ncbi:MAG TPA: hypothetical protein VFG14_15525, partial [Chthoniobacteraceae bacterium]|nr:hypothetical protein [Chthoniobacteraceae bacterium]
YHSIFNKYTIRGNMRRYFEELRCFEVLLIAGEVNASFSGKPSDLLTGAWHDYLLGSSHDYTLVGGGLNGWYGAATKSNYRGPVQISFQRTLENIMSAKLEAWSETIRESLAVDEAGEYLTNPHGFTVPAPRFDGVGTASKAVLPPFASLKVPPVVKRLASAVPEGEEGVLDNGRVRCLIDSKSGAVKVAQWQGRSLWDDSQMGVSLSDGVIAVVDGELHDAKETTEGQSVTHRGRLVGSDGKTLGWVETSYLLKAGTDDLLVDVSLCPALLPPRGDYDWQKEWKNAFRYRLPRVSRSPMVWVCQGNALLRGAPGERNAGAAEQSMPDARAHVISPEVLGDESDDGHSVWYYNTGFPLYLVYEDRIEQFIRMPGEDHLGLRFGLGFGRSDSSPVQRSRMLLHAPFRTSQSMPALPFRWENQRIGLLRTESHHGSGTRRLWFWNYSDRDELFALEIAPDYRSSGIIAAGGGVRRDGGESRWIVKAYSLFYLELIQI